MATQEFTPSAATEATVFSSINAASVVRNVKAARVILRTVALALGAVEDGSTTFDDSNHSSRWSGAIGEACSRLTMVRDDLINLAEAPTLDWVTPLTLIEAFDAALWHGYSFEDERLSNREAVCAAEVVIDSLDSLLQECASGGLASVPPVH